jgi:hypothetical protein
MILSTQMEILMLHSVDGEAEQHRPDFLRHFLVPSVSLPADSSRDIHAQFDNDCQLGCLIQLDSV